MFVRLYIVIIMSPVKMYVYPNPMYLFYITQILSLLWSSYHKDPVLCTIPLLVIVS